jgi:hypothetical protein
MSDDLEEVGKPDRDRVSANEPYEVKPLAEKYDVPVSTVQNVIREEGPMRTDVERALQNLKKNEDE